VKVALFSDARPGHEKQSRGIVQALQRYTNVSAREVKVAQRSGLSETGSHLRYFLHLDHSTVYEIEADTELILGTGSRTHIPMLTAARNTRARVVTCMTPAAHLRSRFDLCFVPYHDRPSTSENVFVTVGPPNVSSVSGTQDPLRRLILLGGEDKRSHYWDGPGVADNILRLIKLDSGCHWTISTSPRTPAHTEELIGEISVIYDQISYKPFSATEPGWLELQYQINGWVWVTGDSISMVYEALSSGCRVGVIPVAWRRANNKFQRSLNYLHDNKLIITLDRYMQGYSEPGSFDPLDEADRCAREILRRWWPKNLP